MALAAAIELVLLAAALAAVLWRPAHTRRALGPAPPFFLVLLVTAAVLRSAAQAAGYGAAAAVHCVRVTEPLLWGLVFYALVNAVRQRRLREGQAKHQSLLDSLRQQVCVKDADMVYVSANEAFAAALGLRPDDVIGKTDLDLFEEEVAEARGRADREAMRARVPATRAAVSDPARPGRIIETTRIPLLSKRGRSAGLLTIAAGVSNRSQATDVASRLAAVADASDDAIIGTTRDGTIASWNTGASALYGYSADEAAGKDITDLVADELRPHLAQALQQVRRGESLRHYETVCVTRDGRRVNASLTLSPIHSAGGAVPAISVIARDVTEQARRRGELRMMSLADPLTNLHNRRGFCLLAEQQLKVAARNKEPVLMIFADVDSMKTINDTLGHSEGDHALTDAARVLRGAFRQSDIVARIGGDEFAVLMPDASAEDGNEILARLERNVAACNSDPTRQFDLSLSVGVSVYDPETPKTLEQLLSEADTAMYADKHAKHGRRDAES
jgi:diguanylate cyclase (GGDEF)-like protein/PAS domain S-box-containing protein